MLCKIVWFEPQAAYSSFLTGFKHKPTFYMITISNISSNFSLFKRLDEVITNEFIPGEISCSVIKRKLMSLPPKLGGTGITFLLRQSQGVIQAKVEVAHRVWDSWLPNSKWIYMILINKRGKTKVKKKQKKE